MGRIVKLGKHVTALYLPGNRCYTVAIVGRASNRRIYIWGTTKITGTTLRLHEGIYRRVNISKTCTMTWTGFHGKWLIGGSLTGWQGLFLMIGSCLMPHSVCITIGVQRCGHTILDTASFAKPGKEASMPPDGGL